MKVVLSLFIYLNLEQSTQNIASLASNFKTVIVKDLKENGGKFFCSMTIPDHTLHLLPEENLETKTHHLMRSVIQLRFGAVGFPSFPKNETSVVTSIFTY